MNLIVRTMVAICLLAATMICPVWAAQEAAPRTIHVSGDAEVRVMPDEAIINLEVVTNNKDLDKAAKENHERVSKVLAAVRGIGVDERDMQTGQISIKPQYNMSRSYGGGRTPDNFICYLAEKKIAIRLKDLTKFDQLLRGVINAGTNYVHGITFRTTKLRECRDKARAMAIRAAKDKADALAGQLGQKVGKPLIIKESRRAYPAYRHSLGSQVRSSIRPMVQWHASEGFAPGEITVSAQIEVTFELE